MNALTPISHRVVWLTLVALLAIGVVIGVRAAATVRRGEQACEAQGQFYWHGKCVPDECRFYDHP